VSSLKNQEWKAFLHNLGGAVVDGFQDRVRRYDEELIRDGRRSYESCRGMECHAVFCHAAMLLVPMRHGMEITMGTTST
jgi:hypothetical protein